MNLIDWDGVWDARIGVELKDFDGYFHHFHQADGKELCHGSDAEYAFEVCGFASGASPTLWAWRMFDELTLSPLWSPLYPHRGTAFLTARKALKEQESNE